MQLHRLDVAIDEVVVSSTVPRVVFNLRVLCDRYFGTRPLVVGRPDCRLPVEVRVDEGTAVGPDRLVNTVAAHDLHGGDAIVVDFGTATTFDVVGSDGAYVGGVIAPGVNLSLEALHQAAAALPHVDITKPQRVVGTNTVACMQSGIFWGYVGLVREIRDRIRAERDRPMTVIATGGLAPLFPRRRAALRPFPRRADHAWPHRRPPLQQGAAMSAERLIYLPLGGAGEVGMNAYVYGYGEPDRERLIVVDLGVTFPDMDTTPGVDLIMPDLSWLEERRERIEGIFVTHAHEDHVGAPGPPLVAPARPRPRAPLHRPHRAAQDGGAGAGSARRPHRRAVPGGRRVRALHGALHAGVALHPRERGARDRHARRTGRAHRRLQARPDAGARRRVRPRPVGRGRAPRRARAGVRLDQRRRGPPRPVGARHPPPRSTS